VLVVKGMTSHYRMLGLEPSATTEQIKSAWRQLSLAKHPDRNAWDPSATDRYRRIREARDCLLDPVARAAHDAELRRAAQRSGAQSLESMFSAILLGEWARQTQAV
jgi:curved DNA-binding protein CbpA